MLQVSRNHNCLTYKNDAYDVNHIRENDYNCDLHILVCPIDQNIYSENNDQEKSISSTIRDTITDSLATTSPKTILVPVDRNILIENFKYFEVMFRKGSNWIEGIDRDVSMSLSENDGVPAEKKQKLDRNAKTIKIHMAEPELFVKYLQSVYTKRLDVTQDNCIDFHYIADYLQDDEMLIKISDFIVENLSYSNVAEVLSLSFCNIDSGKFKVLNRNF